MSTEKTTPRNTEREPTKAGLVTENPAATGKPAIQEVEVTSLQLDESYDVDCDPYNCTGQFLIDAAKLENGE